MDIVGDAIALLLKSPIGLSFQMLKSLRFGRYCQPVNRKLLKNNNNQFNIRLLFIYIHNQAASDITGH